MVVVDAPLLVHAADGGMQVGDAAGGLLMEPDGVLAPGKMGWTGANGPVPVFDHLFVELIGEVVPQLLPILHPVEAGMFGRRAQLDADNGILDRSMLGQGQLHGVPDARSVQFGRQPVVQYAGDLFGMPLVARFATQVSDGVDAVRDGFGFCNHFSSGFGVDGTRFCSRTAVRKSLTASAMGRSLWNHPAMKGTWLNRVSRWVVDIP